MNWKDSFIAKFWLTAATWKRGTVALLLITLGLAPLRSRAQLGLDPCCAIISAGLNSISGLLKDFVAKPLSQIQDIEQQARSFEQQVVFPIAAISSARRLAAAIAGQMNAINRLFRTPVNSATLALPQQFERAISSHNPQAFAPVSQSYAALYGMVMPPNDAPEPVRQLVDMTDAEAQSAFKKAVELDALADIEIAAADQINKQLQTAAPGTAPMLQAQASAWLVRANAYSQSAMAELIRVRSIDLANSAAQLKLNSADVNNLRNNTGQALGHGAQ